ncbi:MAG: hypothetical protein ACKOAD_06460 [Gammaproteobacteria bacterium]
MMGIEPEKLFDLLSKHQKKILNKKSKMVSMQYTDLRQTAENKEKEETKEAQELGTAAQAASASFVASSSVAVTLKF